MSTLVPLKFKPGLVRDMTHYANTGGWYDSNWVRFRMGQPEKMGGWVKEIEEQFLGTCRFMTNWTTLDGSQYLALGTNIKFYVSNGGTYTDVTPLRKTTSPMANNPFAAQNGLTTVTVTDVANAATEGDYVTFSGATTFAGIPAADLNKEHRITSIIDPDNYTIEVATTATGTVSGGGAAVVAEYQINIGLDTSVTGIGWGTGTWGSGYWGISTGSGPQLGLRIWTGDTFGEDLVTGVRNGGIYYWDATAPTDRMVELQDLGGVSDPPVVATEVMVSPEESHVIAFGTNQIGSATQDPLFIRWSDAESAVDWTPDITNSAGGYRLSVGTSIVNALHTRSEILVWTDMALYSMRWTGAPYTFSFTMLGNGTNLIGMNGAIAINDMVFWMGREQFYFYDGRIQPLNCPILDYLQQNMDFTQLDKVFAFSNSLFNEVGWLYQSINGTECDSYVIFNWVERAWYFGSLNRTAWLDRGPAFYPLATSDDSYLYDHEVGMDDGSTNPASPINAYIESSPMEIDADGMGMHFVFLTRLIPDITFRDSTATAPAVDMTVKMQDYPGENYSQTYDSAIVQSATVPIEQFTRQAFIRLRGRSAVFRCESTEVGVTWRLGVPRIEMRPDGRR